VNDRLGDTNKLHEYLMGGIPSWHDLPEIRRVVTLGDPAVGELFMRLAGEHRRSDTAVIDDPVIGATPRARRQPRSGSIGASRSASWSVCR